ncbi:MAG: cereblon family protein [Desulfobacterales bacterium]|jgi:hypothetical protein|nr:cereblon family protein [Desulfobacterales bacterium]MDP6682833.1 cereblon family protein [Desulfobacterales bacterium]MDP6807812.1 cereblon family protein [Desulfobacterales bacterium]|tara:strand:+ start:26553 stop:26981 length:429 start_codon:yes stop_codon:yes gene_type:complete
MMALDADAIFYFRLPSQGKDKAESDRSTEDETEKRPSGNDKFIVCRQCRQIITSPAERIEMEGVHRHTFTNPHGIVYQIGCFKSVTGCGYAGPASDEWSWFKGFSWRVAVCGTCLLHVGWLFVSKSGYRFSGLILDRIVEIK